MSIKEAHEDFGGILDTSFVCILFPHQDHRAFAEAIMRLHGDQELYSEVAKACGQRAAAYDISKMVEGYIKVYDGLCTEK